MGFTRRWTRPDRFDESRFELWCDDVKLIVNAAVDELGIRLTGSYPPHLGPHVVSFRDADVGAEEFSVGYSSLRVEIVSCETRRLAYDVVVAAALIMLQSHFGDLVTIGSDGNNIADWIDGMALCHRAVGYTGGAPVLRTPSPAPAVPAAPEATPFANLLDAIRKEAEEHESRTAGIGQPRQLSEGQRQLVLLALGRLAAERRGWDYALVEVAKVLEGEGLFQKFQSLRLEELGRSKRVVRRPGMRRLTFVKEGA